MLRILTLILAIVLPACAQAQGTIQQSGAVAAGQVPMFTGNGRVMGTGGAPSPGQPPNNKAQVGTLPSGIAAVNSGQPYAAYSGYATGSAYSRFLWGFDGAGNARITVDSPNGNTPTCTFVLNGTDYACFGSVGATFRHLNPLNFYVAPAGDGGDDNNDCTAATQGAGTQGPCRTIRHAAAVALQYDSHGQYLLVNVAAGTYTDPIELGGVVTGSGTYPVGNSSSLGGIIYIRGTSGSAATFLTVATGTGCGYFGSAVSAFNGMVIALEGLTISTSCTNGSDIDSESGSFVETIDDVVLGSANVCHGKTENGGILSFVGSGVTVRGNSIAVLCAGAGGKIEVQPGGVLTCDGAMTVTNGFVTAQGNSTITFGAGSSTSGCTVTGPQFDLTGNSILEVQSSNSNLFIPGSTRGFIHSGARYVPDNALAPTLSSCGTSPSISGGDDSGVITVGGGGVTACTVTYAYPTQLTRHCTISGDNSGNVLGFTSQNATAFAAFASSSFSGAQFYYVCRYQD